MPTPAKPFKVLSTEKKSHRTQAEMELLIVSKINSTKIF